MPARRYRHHDGDALLQQLNQGRRAQREQGGADPGRSGVDAARGVSPGPVGLSRMLVDPALPGPTLPTGVNFGTAGLTPCPGACKGNEGTCCI